MQRASQSTTESSIARWLTCVPYAMRSTRCVFVFTLTGGGGESAFGILEWGGCGYTNSDATLAFPKVVLLYCHALPLYCVLDVVLVGNDSYLSARKWIRECDECMNGEVMCCVANCVVYVAAVLCCLAGVQRLRCM